LNSGFKWVVSPEQQLIPAIKKYGKDALIAVQGVANYWGQFIQNEARERVDSEHKWVTRTGAAQGGLFFAVDGFGMSPIIGEASADAKAQMSDVAVESGDDNTLIITLGHTVYYGKWLEIMQAGARGVVMSTIEKNLPMLERMLIDSLK
jgi:hypothetical protein